MAAKVKRFLKRALCLLTGGHRMKEELVFFKYKYEKCRKCGKTRWMKILSYDHKGYGSIL